MAKKAKEFTVTDGKLVLRLELADEGGYVVTAPFNPDVLTQADSLEEATDLSYGFPDFDKAGSVEVREIVPM